jgi:hypothetical protein
MIKKINRIFLFATTLFLGHAAFAGSNDGGGCGELSMLLVNTTQDTCKLTNQQLIHGYLNNTSHIPSFIPPNTTAPALDLEQSFMGIEIKLSYQCGENKKISLYAGQNYSFLSAGTITSQIIEKQNMDIEFFIREGSCLWNQHGTISWNLVG